MCANEIWIELFELNSNSWNPLNVFEIEKLLFAITIFQLKAILGTV